MGDRYSKTGGEVYYTAGETLAVNAPVAIGLYSLGILNNAMVDGDVDLALTSGEFELDATSADVWAAGDKLYFDDTTDKLTDVVASGVYFAGFAPTAKISGETRARVILRPFAEEGPRILTLAAATTLTVADFLGGGLTILSNTSGGAFTVVLPAVASTPNNAELFVYNTTGTNAITLDGNASETIAGSATFATIDAVGDHAAFVNTGALWLAKYTTIA